MAASTIQICNMALLRVGGQTISSLDEGSRESQLCSAFLEQCREQILRAFPWPFARRRVALADLGTPVSNWGYRYAYPSDCIQALRIVYPGLRLPLANQNIPFEVSSSATQRVIHCDWAGAELEYTARVTDPSLYDSQFISAFAWLLAAEIAMPLIGKPEPSNLARQHYMLALSEAAAQALSEGCSDPEPAGEFLSARGVTL